MIDVTSSKVMRVFEQYMKNYNLNKSNIKTKYFHSLKVMELCRDIATVLGIFTEEEIVICEIIGLFHEIASFDSNTHSTYEDDTEDLARKSVDILFDKGLMRKITQESKYDNTIKIAIYCHNKNDLPNKLDPKMAHFCKVLKDANAIDTFRMVLNYPYLDMHIDEFPTNLVYNDFKLYKSVNKKVSDNNADNILVVLSSIFSLNYRYSYALVKENAYVSKINHALIFKDKDLQKFFRQIEAVLNKKIDKYIREGK